MDPLRRHLGRLDAARIGLVGQRVHDDVVGHDAQRVDVLHQDGGRHLVELDELEEGGDDLAQDQTGVVAVLLGPHERSLVKIVRNNIRNNGGLVDRRQWDSHEKHCQK